MARKLSLKEGTKNCYYLTITLYGKKENSINPYLRRPFLERELVSPKCSWKLPASRKNGKRRENVSGHRIVSSLFPRGGNFHSRARGRVAL